MLELKRDEEAVEALRVARETEASNSLTSDPLPPISTAPHIPRLESPSRSLPARLAGLDFSAGQELLHELQPTEAAGNPLPDLSFHDEEGYADDDYNALLDMARDVHDSGRWHSFNNLS